MTAAVRCVTCDQEAARLGSAGLAGLRLPPELVATAPPPRRDAVRLLVGRKARDEVTGHCFRELPALLRAGDVLVVNTSRTLPAAVDGRLSGTAETVVVHCSTRRARRRCRAPGGPSPRHW